MDWTTSEELGCKDDLLAVAEDAQREDDILTVAAAEMLALIPDGVVGTDASGTVLFLSPVAERLFEYAADEVIGRSICQLLPERFHESHEAFMLRFGVAGGEEQRLMADREEVLGRRKDGSEFPAEVSISRRRLGQRTILTAVVRDITERRQLEQQLEQQCDLLVSELNHRISNLMSVVQSVIRLTAQHHDTAQSLRDALQERLNAVAERQQLISREGWTSVGLDSLLSAELRPYAAPDGGNLELEGSPQRISAAAATSLGLVLHELATNSAKYGALSSPSGHLSVSWHPDEGAKTLKIAWDERGGPEVKPPQREGFGTSLVQRVLTFQFGGDVQMAYPPAGFQAHVRLPLSKLR